MFGKSVFKTYSNFINLFAKISDPVAILMAAIFSHFYLSNFENVIFTKELKILIVFSCVSTVIIFPYFNLYGSWRGQSSIAQAKSVIFAWSTILILMIVVLFSFGLTEHFSRAWLGLWAISGFLFILFARLCVYYFLHYQRKKGKNLRFILIIGAGELGQKAANQIKASPWTGYQIKAYFDDDKKLHGKFVDNVEVKGGIDDVEDYLSANHVDEIWVALPLRSDERMKQLHYSLRQHPIYVKLILDIFGFNLMYHSLTEVAGLPAVNLTDSPMNGSNRVVKSLEDWIIALIILLLISPLMFVIALIIKVTSKGPVLYTQERVSWNGDKFKILKFRTMKGGSDKVIWGNSKSKDITWFGKFLRKTSLDELPQFINVLKGDMSIVGPRPERTVFVDKFKDEIPRYMQKHLVKAGITGWAQINGWRGDTCITTRIDHDLYYIDNWSLLLDLKIIVLTIVKAFKQKNAY